MYRGNRWHMVWFKENHEIWRICRSPILFPKPLALSCEISLKGPKAWQLHRNVARLPGFSPAFLGLGHQPLPVKLNWKLSRKPQPRPWIHIHFTTPRHCEEMWITFPNYSCFKYLPSQTKSNAQSSARVHYKLHYSTGCPILSSLVAAASAPRRDQGLGPFFWKPAGIIWPIIVEVSPFPIDALVKPGNLLLDMRFWSKCDAACNSNLFERQLAGWSTDLLKRRGVEDGYQCWHKNLGFSWDDSQGGSI